MQTQINYFGRTWKPRQAEDNCHISQHLKLAIQLYGNVLSNINYI